jgi:hypothetical protein
MKDAIKKILVNKEARTQNAASEAVLKAAEKGMSWSASPETLA